MDIYLVRHGETESNRERRYLGWTESPLSTLGLRQAERTAYFLAGERINALYCSDLNRAFHTARVIGKSCALQPEPCSLLREIHFGQWEGLTFDEIEKAWGDRISRWLDDPYHHAAPGGESLKEVCSRMHAFLEDLNSLPSAGQRIAAVSHGGSIRALLFKVLGLDRSGFWDIKIDNASVSLIRKEGDHFKVIYYNRTHHLGDGNQIEEGVNDNQ